MAWAWLCTYLFVFVMILQVNNALNIFTFSEFVRKFKILVDEMALYFEPCGFPIELMERCQNQTENVGQEIKRLAVHFTEQNKKAPQPV